MEEIDWYLIFTSTMPLIGVLIGGLVTYFTVRTTEQIRWKQQKIDKFQEEYRQVLITAMDWIDPYRDAIYQANKVLGDFLMERKSESEYLVEWPKLVGHPELKDPPKKLRVFLPDDIYPRFLTVLRNLDDIRILPLHTQRGTKDFFEAYRETGKLLDALEQEIERLNEKLIAEYKGTYKPKKYKEIG